MSKPKLSVVVPTHNRPAKLRATVAGLMEQEALEAADYEVIVVDDGSSRPVELEPASIGSATVTVVRLEGVGPSGARNRGAEVALSELLVFVDDDIQLGPTFLASHWQAHLEWPGVLQVGSVRLPDSALATPFGRFRQDLEDNEVPEDVGKVAARNFCTAANLAVGRATFERLGGFDAKLSTGEDQDLALRHTERGGDIVFVPSARVVHDDDALGVESYCLRAERYMEELVRFGARHPDLPDTITRARVNGPIRFGGEPVGLSAKKAIKDVLIWAPVHRGALRLVSLVERAAPDSGLLDKLYRTMLGAHLRRGYRRGLRSERA